MTLEEQITSAELIPRKLLTISIEGSGDIRVLENDTFEKLEYNGETYLCGPLKVSDVIKNDGGDFQYINIEISNASQAISGVIGNEGDVLTGAMCLLEEVFLDEDKNILEQNSFPVFVGQANNLHITVDKLSLDIEAILGGYVNLSPNMTYGVMCQWRKFKDCRCAYSGAETSCDKSFARCKELGNTANFGGFPSIPREQVIKTY